MSLPNAGTRPGTTSQNLRALPREGLWVILRALQEVLGEADFKAVIARAGLPDVYTDLAGKGVSWPPATHNMTGSITRAVFDIYPRDKAQELLLAAGRAQFRHAQENLPTFINMIASMLPLMPRDMRMKIALEQGARDLKRSSNALPVLTSDAASFYVTDVASPTCAGQSATFPMCITRVGILSAAAEWAAGAPVNVSETACRAMGAAECRFVIPKVF